MLCPFPICYDAAVRTTGRCSSPPPWPRSSTSLPVGAAASLLPPPFSSLPENAYACTVLHFTPSHDLEHHCHFCPLAAETIRLYGYSGPAFGGTKRLPGGSLSTGGSGFTRMDVDLSKQHSGDLPDSPGDAGMLRAVAPSQVKDLQA